ncbi:rod shape-determining protein MreC [Peribacillus muralis]|uniref:Cell shape-determining protein MreC n=1 Tax=Peribacillus muralis TaxID=264697 RepID=A0A1B3XRU4_9BACI|nr:rod shape-determining protein MreC [Peribacillus muralis]AOH55940.1 rod shape-determining protein MreC [Peribacillus muralis]
MPQFFNKKLLLLLVSIIVLVALIGFSLKEREELTWPEQFLKDTTGWVGNVFNKPVSGITGFVGGLKDLQHTYDENKKLKARLDEYVLLKTQVQDLKEENDEFRDNLKKEDDLRKYSSIQSTVIGRNPDRWNEMLTINKGKRNGVEKNMAVIKSNVLVGKVKSATDFTASVQLLSSIDKANRVSAIVQGDKAYGLIEGFDDKRNLLLMKRIPYDKKIKKGSTVITSGYGGIFPKGLLIGKVVDVKVDQYGLNQTAYIEPATDLYDINNVMVVQREVGGVADESDGEDEVE